MTFCGGFGCTGLKETFAKIFHRLSLFLATISKVCVFCFDQTILSDHPLASYGTPKGPNDTVNTYLFT